MVPSDGNGQIGALLESLQPPQHYSHMGIMTRDGTEVRQCTESADWLRKHAVGTLGYPTDGFYEKAMRFGWPGTITQTVEAAWRSTRGDTEARTLSSRDGSVHATLPDLHVQGPVWAPYVSGHEVGLDGQAIQVPNDANVVSLEPFVLSELGLNPVSVPVLDGVYAQQMIFGDPDHALPPDRDANISWTTMWPLVVKPCPRLASERVLAALQRVADAAASLPGHYRFNGYVNAFSAEDPAQYDHLADWGGHWLEDTLPASVDPCHRDIPVATTRGMVCSTFIWEAVREANRQERPHIWLTVPHDRDRPAGCESFYVPPAGDAYDRDEDGLFDYPAAEIRRTALWFAAAMHRSIDEEASSMPWWASPLESAFEFFSDIQDDVANQLGNTFAFDHCAPSYKDDDEWLEHPPAGRSSSPDNIVRSWMPPTPGEVDPENLHGLYGYNEQLIPVRPGHFAERPRLVWDYSEGPGRLDGMARYRNRPVAGAKITVACVSTYTNADGAFTLEAPAGRYLMTAGVYLPQPGDQPAWWAEGEQAIEIVFGTTTPVRIDLHDPPGENRILIVDGHVDAVNRHVIGHDWWGHKTITCPIVHLGNYDIGFDPGGSEGDNHPAGGYSTGWNYKIDGGWNTAIDVRAKRIDQAATNPADPYPLEVTVTFKLGSDGAGWPFSPEAETSSTTIVPTDGTGSTSADLKTGVLAPLRSHIDVNLHNFRQG